MRLALDQPTSFDRAEFVVSSSNDQAVALVDAWPDWPGGRLALIGPAGAGKTHLARAWAARAGAAILYPSADGDGEAAALDPESCGRRLSAPEAGAVLLEDADSGFSDERLFHLINRADMGASVLLTARLAPALWPVRLPDLLSRLAALMVARIEPPDDAVLEGVLRRLFKARRIRPAEDVYPYLVRRIERSVPAARDVVSRLDELADAQGREVNRSLARQLIEQDDSGELFD